MTEKSIESKLEGSLSWLDKKIDYLESDLNERMDSNDKRIRDLIQDNQRLHEKCGVMIGGLAVAFCYLIIDLIITLC